jgi:hypothetical protein
LFSLELKLDEQYEAEPLVAKCGRAGPLLNKQTVFG